MNNSTNSMTEEKLPDGLQQAVAATNRLVPDRESESRAVKLAMSIPTKLPAEVITSEYGQGIGRPLRLIAIPVGLAALALVIPWSFAVTVDGQLHPKERHEIFVKQKGVVVEIPEGLDHGSVVEKGDVLLVMQDNDLDSRIEANDDELQRLIADRSIVDRQRRKADLPPEQHVSNDQQFRSLDVKIKTLERTQALLNKQRDALTIKSPVHGTVLNFQLRRNLMNRPLNRGDNVMTIANLDGEWVIAAYIPTDAIEQIAEATSKKGIDVRWVRKSKPEKKFKARLSPLAINNAVKQTGHLNGSQVVVPIEVNPADFDQPLATLRPGEEVVLVIPCGKTTLGYVCFHKLIEFAQLNLFF